VGLWRYSSPDDRGKAVPVVQVNDLRDPENTWRWQDREAADLAGRIMTIAADEQQKKSWRVGVVFGVSMMVMGIGAGEGWLPQRWLLPLAVVLGGGIGLAFQIRGRRRAAPEVRKTTLSRCRCAACGYSLQGCIVQGDACVV
jgi:hypothetical protein